MDWHRLNVFQRLTRQWDALHPYNAAQVMRVAVDASDDEVRESYAAMLAALGLSGAVRYSSGRFRFEPVVNRSATKDFIPVDSSHPLTELLTAELNRTIEVTDNELPIRPNILPTPDNTTLL